MTARELAKLKDSSFAHIEGIYQDVLNGRYDNTNTRQMLDACRSMHEAACREIREQEQALSTCKHDQADTLERCIGRLAEYVANEASPTRLIEETLADLRKLAKGGAS